MIEAWPWARYVYKNKKIKMAKPKNLFSRYSYVWVTLVLFLCSLAAHWTFAWYAFVNEQHAHAQPVVFNEYLVEVLRDTFENWQSEFLQLIWQVAGLAFLFFIGSPQSKEGDDRIEEKLDLVLKKLDPENAVVEIKALDKKYERTK
jgi:hypothetical protein